jgi:hypothetical protein
VLSIARDLNGETRFVIYKDGPIRSSEELRDILNAFRDIAKQFRFKVVDVIGVIKRPNFRVFELSKDRKRC